MCDRVKEIAASKVLCDDTALIDPLEIFNNIHYELAVSKFSQQGHLGGCSVLEIIIPSILELNQTLSQANSFILIVTLPCYERQKQIFHDD